MEFLRELWRVQCSRLLGFGAREFMLRNEPPLARLQQEFTVSFSETYCTRKHVI